MIAIAFCVPTAAARSLGIVASDAVETDARLEILGIGASGDVLASLELRGLTCA